MSSRCRTQAAVTPDADSGGGAMVRPDASSYLTHPPINRDVRNLVILSGHFLMVLDRSVLKIAARPASVLSAFVNAIKS